MAGQDYEPGAIRQGWTAVKDLAVGMYNAVTRDGTVDAFFRQLAGELANALTRTKLEEIIATEPASVSPGSLPANRHVRSPSQAESAVETQPVTSTTPSEIVRQAAREAAAMARGEIGDVVEEIRPEQSGLLSPDHTPGRSR